MKKNKELLINTVAFGIGSFLSKFLSLFLLTLYTNVFSVAEYGMMDMFITTSTLLLPIVTISIFEGILRFSLDNRYENNKVISTSFIIVIVVNILIFPVLFIISKTLFSKKYAFLFYLYLLNNVIYQMVSYSVKGLDKVKLFTVSGILLSVLILIFNYLFLIGLKMGLNGYLIANSLAYLFISIFLIVSSKIHKYIHIKCFSKRYGKEIIKYCFFLIPNAIFWWVINSSDRYMIKWFCDLHELGLFSAAYKFPSMMFMISSIFIQAWNISSMKENDSNLSVFVKNIYDKYSFVVILSCSVLILFIKPLTMVFMGKSYFESWVYAPPLVLSFAFSALSTFVGSIYLVKKENFNNMMTTLIGCLINIILNYYLIQVWQGFGASIATLIAQLIIYLIRCKDTQKYLKVNYLNRTIRLSFLFLILQSIMLYCRLPIVLNLLFFFFLCIINKKNVKIIFKIFIKKMKLI